MSQQAFFTLNNGVRMPALGLGVFQSSAVETTAAVATALADGYRLVDTAARYGNEYEVGQGIARSGIERDQIFVTSKLWFSDYGYSAALRAFDRSLALLGLEYLDLYLLHWPVPSIFEDTVAAWMALETLLAEGCVRAIGVSNFSSHHLQQLTAQTMIVPAVNQVELHPFFFQPQLLQENAERGIVTQAWSPIGGIRRYWKGGEQFRQEPLGHPLIGALAQKYGKSPAQIVLRWHIELGVSAIPKSVSPVRIAENIDIFDFSLDADEVAAICALDTGERGGPDPERVSAQFFAS